jgi:tetratricopeptide (TPR) repeat protein
VRAPLFVSVVVLLACSCACKDVSKAGDPRTLRPVALPDLSRLEESVQAQLHERFAALTEKQKNPRAPAAELGTEYGEMGMLLMAAEFRDPAEASFLNAQALAPGDMRWPYYLGHLYKTKGDIPSAVTAFERALQSAPNDVPTMAWLGEAALDQGRPDAAESLFSKALSLQPRSIAARYGLGRAALAKQDYVRAAEHLEQALALDDKASIIHYPLAMAYRGLGDRRKAELHLQQRGTVQIQPDDPLKKALDELLHSALTYETNGDAAGNRGQWAAAVEYLRKGVALAPTRASLRGKLGTALFYTGDRRGAFEQFQEAVRLSPRLAIAHYSLGVMHEEVGEHLRAIQSFSAAVQAEPDYLDARLGLADALRRNGQLEPSLAQYEQIVRADPRAVKARFGYAAALIRLARYQEARNRLAEAMDRYPDEMAFARAAARLLAAAPDDRVRDGRRAMAIAQMLLGRQPRSIELAETIAMTSAEVGQYADAVMWQQQAIDAAGQAGRRDLVERLTGNLALYQAHRPCRTPWRADEPIEFYSSSGRPAESPRP